MRSMLLGRESAHLKHRLVLLRKLLQGSEGVGEIFLPILVLSILLLLLLMLMLRSLLLTLEEKLTLLLIQHLLLRL